MIVSVQLQTLFDNTISNKELFELDCDILVPVMISNQITEDNANDIKADIIVEVLTDLLHLKLHEF